MSEFMGAFGNPIVSGLMGLAQGFGNAAMPSRMPIPLGAAFGSAMGGMNDAMTNAQKLKLLAQQEERMRQQTDIARQEFELKKQIEDNAQSALPGALQSLNSNPFAASQQGAPTRPMGGGLQANLVNSESGGRPDVVNAQGYSGKYQFGAPLLVDLGMYNAGQNEGIGGPRPGGWGGAKWSGQFNIPGFPDVKTHADFLRNPDAQDAAYNAAMARNDKLLEQAGAYNSVGQTINGVPVTREGLLKGAWLGGVGGVTSWLKSGGAMDPADANGTKVSNYIRSGAAAAAQPAAMAGGGQPSASADMGAPPAISNFPPQAQRTIRLKAEEAWNTANRLEMQAAILSRSPSTKGFAEALQRSAAVWRKAGMWQEEQLPDGRTVYVHALGAEPPRVIEQPRTREIRNPDGSMRTELDRPGLVSEREVPAGYVRLPDGSLGIDRGGPADKPVEITERDDAGNEIRRLVPPSQLMQPQGGATGAATPTPGVGGVTARIQAPAITTATRTDLEADTKNIRGALSRLEKARADFDPSFLTMSGRGANAGRAWVEWATGYLPEGEKKKLEAYTAFTTNTINTLNEHIKAITGAAMGVEEAKRLMAAMPNPNDSPTQFLAKLQVVEDGLRAAQERIGGMARTGIRGQENQPAAQSGMREGRTGTLNGRPVIVRGGKVLYSDTGEPAQ